MFFFSPKKKKKKDLEQKGEGKWGEKYKQATREEELGDGKERGKETEEKREEKGGGGGGREGRRGEGEGKGKGVEGGGEKRFLGGLLAISLLSIVRKLKKKRGEKERDGEKSLWEEGGCCRSV